MIKQELTQRQQQKLSPAQIQQIKLLELPNTDLEQRITQEIINNEALEEGHDDSEDFNKESDDLLYEDDYQDNQDSYNSRDDFNIDQYISDDEVPDYAVRTHNTSKDDQHEDIPFSVGQTFHEFLLQELHLLPLAEQDMQIGEFIIGSLDENGYLNRDVESIVDDLSFHVGIYTTDDNVSQILSQIQTLEPAGVGARNLQECLLIQLRRKPRTTAVKNATTIIERYFNDFKERHFDRIIQRSQLTEEQMKEALDEIGHLNPKPGNAWGANIVENNQEIIIPDFIIENDNGNIVISLNNGNIPELRINHSYNEMMLQLKDTKNKTARDRDTFRYISQKIDSARWFIDAIKQRNETLLRTMTAIVNFQHDFFNEGDESYLKPMILKDIADMTGYDISTISRVSNSKYAQTEFGILPLKFFFSEAMTTDEGDEISTRQIRKDLLALIESEDKRHPLNDDQLVALMKLQGYQIARRTIAKYRSQLHIPVARLRKQL